VRFVNGLGVSAFVPSIALGSGNKECGELKGTLLFLFLQNDSIFIGEKDLFAPVLTLSDVVRNFGKNAT
jgi:hypothetical protein